VLTEEQKIGLGIALNEASLLGVSVDPESESAVVTFAPLSLPAEGPAQEGYEVRFLLKAVGRVVASLRMGRWNDPAARVASINLGELQSTVQSFEGLPIYGWEFFDTADFGIESLGGRISLDWSGETGDTSHSLMLFQEGPDRHLDLFLWFDSFEIRGQNGDPIPIDAFIEGGKRWWDGLRCGDPRTKGQGIFPLK